MYCHWFYSSYCLVLNVEAKKKSGISVVHRRLSELSFHRWPSKINSEFVKFHLYRYFDAKCRSSVSIQFATCKTVLIYSTDFRNLCRERTLRMEWSNVLKVMASRKVCTCGKSEFGRTATPYLGMYIFGCWWFGIRVVTMEQCCYLWMVPQQFFYLVVYFYKNTHYKGISCESFTIFMNLREWNVQ